jgi:hypothetical protein
MKKMNQEEIYAQFRREVREWYRFRSRHAAEARQAAYRRAREGLGSDWVCDHQPEFKRALDDIERAVRAELGVVDEM